MVLTTDFLSVHANSRSSVTRFAATVGKTQVVVGVPSYRNARTVADVIRAAAMGLDGLRPGIAGVLLNSDGGSTDGTGAVAGASASNSNARYLSFLHAGPPGKGRAVLAILEVADALGAEVCILFDADLRSIRPDWIPLLASPILESGFDLVAPSYRRDKSDGTLTNTVMFPVMAAVAGAPIRQPIGGEFGLSRRLIGLVRQHSAINGFVGGFGIDALITTSAACAGFRLAQSRLGVKIHDPKDPGSRGDSIFPDEVGTLFDVIALFARSLTRRPLLSSISTFGKGSFIQSEPVQVDTEQLFQLYRLGQQEHYSTWSNIISHPKVLHLLMPTTSILSTPRIPDQEWATIVYDFLSAYILKKSPLPTLLDALFPLYCAKTADVLLRAASLDAAGFERRILRLKAAFIRARPHFISQLENSTNSMQVTPI